MTCDEFITSFDEWLNMRKVSSLSKRARAHQASCATCARYARETLQVDTLLTNSYEPEPIPDLSHIRDRIIAAHQPREIPLPFLTSLRPAAILAISALCLWGISLLLPVGPSAALQLLLVFAATFILLTKIFKYRKEK